MKAIFDFITGLDWQSWIIALEGLIGAIISIALLIPGEQPEKTLQKVLDFLKSISKK